MNTYIDNYCERLEPGLWAEPLNAMTNAAFLVAAFFAYILARRENALTARSMILITLLCCIGVGSTLFHTFATKLTMLSDVLPILFYQMAFIWLYARHVVRLSFLMAVRLMGVFVLMTILAEQAPMHILNGSLSYTPSLIFLCGFAVYHHKTEKREACTLTRAAAFFTLSLAMRSVDNVLCTSLPFGTHFLWHCLNSYVLYLTTRSYILNAKYGSV